MNPLLTPRSSWVVWGGRLALLLSVVLVLGALGSSPADAVKKHKNKATTSVRDRVMAQADLCYADGGTFGMSRNAFGGTVTTCTGGSQGDWKCTNSKKQTSCGPAYTPPPPDEDGVSPLGDAPPTQGDDGPADGGGGLRPPGTNPDQPSVSDGGGLRLAADRGGRDGRAKHQSKHHRRGKH